MVSMLEAQMNDELQGLHWRAPGELDPVEQQRLQEEVEKIIGGRLPLNVEVVPVRSVGVAGDAHSSDPSVILSLSQPETASWLSLGLVREELVELLGQVSTDIISKVKGIGKVMIEVYPIDYVPQQESGSA